MPFTEHGCKIFVVGVSYEMLFVCLYHVQSVCLYHVQYVCLYHVQYVCLYHVQYVCLYHVQYICLYHVQYVCLYYDLQTNNWLFFIFYPNFLMLYANELDSTSSTNY